MNVTKALLDKYSEGKCTPEEEMAVRHWLEDGSWPDVPGDAVMGAALWNKMEDQLYPDRKVVPIHQSNTRWWKIVATLLILISTGMSAYFLYYKKGIMVVVHTAPSEKKRIVLPDNSVVFLASGSTLQYPATFPADSRQILLSGEASFEVAKDAQRPFTVISEKVHTTALGTSFKVSAYPGTDKVDVALSYGKVVVCNRLKKNTDSTFLAPGEAVAYSATGKEIRKTNNKQFNYRENTLYFQQANMEEVVTKLESFYGIHVVIATQLHDAKWQVSGEFNRESLDIVMKNIAFTCDINYHINQDTLVLAPTER
jgi:transmembrane sensor